MRARTALSVGLAVVMTVQTPAAASEAGAGQGPARGESSTRADVLAALHGEAYDYRVYRAYAAQAAAAGSETAARLFRETAHQERYEHFAELARLAGLVGSDADNLTTAITGEHYEATEMYPAYARQARRDGCAAAAKVFTEISHDEQRHATWYTAARDAITDPDADQRFPVGERVPAAAIPAGPARCTGRTQANLLDAMHGEAFAGVQYALYSEHAQRSGRPRLARLFADVGSQEHNEHFVEEARLAGLVGPTEDNLRTALAGERDEATITYPRYRDRAVRNHDLAARLFDEFAQDEARHAGQFAAALSCR
ncbi:ferritin family protein [Actinoplanes siamensis]|uniref:Ferritin-like diiron domain-containing protein n=1 Tax=Actinoplanes siamensis TaxID=1223317 RepID=A0A919TJZ3_9ACTN|nr:ferritin family protein [Actinoplanes siamensis]GIF04750.1 hypothetical protein Asi03nite_22880 [Actinoplanes siamensis]